MWSDENKMHAKNGDTVKNSVKVIAEILILFYI